MGMRVFLGTGWLLLAIVWCGTAKAHGSFLVNTTADVDDGACEPAPGGDCSLREAILAANALVNDHPDAPDTIAFDLISESEAPFTIALESPLPAITEGVILNGSSEPRYVVAREHVPVIIVDGGGFDHVLEVRSDSTLVIALAFTNAAVSGIDAEDADYLLVQGCYFGIDPSSGASLQSGTDYPAFGSHAIHLRDAFRVRLGGQGELARNVIAGAGAEAILAERVEGLLLHGNYVGVDPAGLEARSNSSIDPSAFAIDIRESDAIEVWGNVVAANLGGGLRLADVPAASVERNLIGLDASGRAGLGNASVGLALGGELENLRIVDNTISANGASGILCTRGSSGAWRMERNIVGVDIAQSDVLPNLGAGIYIEAGCEGATVGSAEPEEGNFIAFNQGAGVRSVDGRATILGNRIFLNQGLSIDVGAAGRSENDSMADLPPMKHPDRLNLRIEDEGPTIFACVATGSEVEVFEALLGDEGSAGAFRLLASGREGRAEDRDSSADCSDSNDAAFELLLPGAEAIGAIVLTATLSGHTSELSDPVSLIDQVPPSHLCASRTDCEARSPICDPVLRQCVYCLDDADGNDVDAGCSTGIPQCTGSFEERTCEGASEGPGEPRRLSPSSASSGCSITPQAETSRDLTPLLLIAFAVLRTRRGRARSNT